jgi:hypothetical protein
MVFRGAAWRVTLTTSILTAATDPGILRNV